jgi:hypothetical protein
MSDADAHAADDPRRQADIKIVFSQDGIGALMVAGFQWGAIEWSDKRGAWCIEDAEGRCLRHAASIHGKAASKEAAIALAEQIVRDGTLPSPEEARRRRRNETERERQKRANRPSEIRRKQEGEKRKRLLRATCDADWEERHARPFFELFAEAFDLADPDLWKSNSFALLRPRLIIEARAAVAELEYRLHTEKWPETKAEIAPKLARAQKILALLDEFEEQRVAPARTRP